MDDMKMLYDLVKEIREDQKEHGKELKKHSEELTKQSTCLGVLQSDVKQVKKDVAKNTEDVAEHMYRTDLLENLHKDNQKRIEQSEKRIEILEEPMKAREYLKRNLHWILTTAGLLATLITKIIGLW